MHAANGSFRQSAPRTASRTCFPLSPIAIVELDRIAGSKDWPRKGFVLTTNGANAICAFSQLKRALDGAMKAIVEKDDPDAQIDAWRLHDLRRTMATGMQRLRIPSEVIEACENRKAGLSRKGAARVYQRHDYATEKREAMDKWGSFLTGLLASKDNVIPIEKATA